MSAVTLMIGLLLATQVSADKGRYGETAATPSGKNATPPPVAPNSQSPASAKPTGGNIGTESPLQPIQPLTPSVPSSRATTTPPPATEDQSPYRPAQQAPPVARPKPSSIMKQMLNPPPGSQLSGVPITLRDVVAGARSRVEQAHRVEAYWDLCSSVADYYLGVLEQEEMRRLRTENPRAGQMLQQAEAKFAVRLDTSKQAAVASQRRLASMTGRGNNSLPLPSDLPHCGSYESYYEKIFASRPSIEAKELHALLPLRYAELKDSAAAVVQTRASLDAIARSDADGGPTLRALELLALQRRAFVQIARDYNRRIARYAELSTPGDISADQLVDMLIKRSVVPTATRPASPSGDNGRQSRNSTTPPPRTFVSEEGAASNRNATGQTNSRDQAVVPAAAEEQSGPREERSLLVSPR